MCDTKRALQADAARNRIAERDADLMPLLEGEVTIDWNPIYQRSGKGFTARLEDNGLALERAASLASTSLSRLELQMKILTGAPVSPGTMAAIARAQTSVRNEDGAEPYEAVDYRNEDPERYTRELYRLPVNLTMRAAQHALGGGYALQTLADSQNSNPNHPRLQPLALPISREAARENTHKLLGQRSGEDNLESYRSTLMLRDALMASPEFLTSDTVRQAVDMLELGRSSLGAVLERHHQLDSEMVRKDRVPFFSDAVKALRQERPASAMAERFARAEAAPARHSQRSEPTL